MREGVPEEASRFHDHYYWLALLVVNAVLGHLAARFYPEEFALFRDAVSDLGATATRSGRANPRSPYVFAIQMVASSVAMLLLARHLYRRGFDRSSPDVRLAELAAVGFLLMPAPHNEAVYHVIHMVGAGFVVFSLWVCAIRYLAVARGYGHHAWHGFATVLLHGGVLTYALLFALASPLKQVAQSVALIAVSLTLIVTTQLLAADRVRVASASEVEPVP